MVRHCSNPDRSFCLGFLIFIGSVLFIGSCSERDHKGLELSPSSSPKGTGNSYQEFYLFDSIRIVLDIPDAPINGSLATKTLVLYALPNGNSIEWSMGKQETNSDNWHFNIQHINAQTQWLRKQGSDFILAYLEAPKLSWPGWKRSHEDYQQHIRNLVDTLRTITHTETVVLSSHSGGGSFINGFIEASKPIPVWVERIVFIDSNYGYDTAIGDKLSKWISSDSDKHLSVFAYNDSVALYEGKPFVSATGGTWYRSKMMLREFSGQYAFVKTEKATLIKNRSMNNQILIILKKNPDREIFHTQQVELNGFIHSLLFDTEIEDYGYSYFEERCYGDFISETIPEFVSLDITGKTGLK